MIMMMIMIIIINNNNNNNNNIVNTIIIIIITIWLTAHKEAIQDNQTSASDWKMAVRRDNVIKITLHQVYSCRLS